MQLSLAEAADLLNAEYRGEDVPFSALSTDSRQLQPGELFFALSGPNFDGHRFVEAAQQRGACAAVVAHWLDYSLPQLKVTDPLRALGQLGSYWRQHFSGKVVALTGSNGKTTTKEMIAAILRTRGSVLATKGNLNNEIGLPLTLSRLADEKFAVIEMGANHPGEIAYLTQLTQPDIALITNVGPAHLEGFGDLAGVARAKGEIFQGLGAGGVAIINRDDDFADTWLQTLQQTQIIDFSLHHSTAVRAEILDHSRSLFRLQSAGDSIEIQLPLPGQHNIANALAAAAATIAAGLTLADIKQGLEQLQAVPGRLQHLSGPYGSRLINDSYNANPASLAAGLQLLNNSAQRSWLVLGDMAELGEKTAEFHRQAGEQARSASVERLYCIGEHSIASAQAFGQNGFHFETLTGLLETLNRDLQNNTEQPPTILIKGSRSMRMEQVVAKLSEFSNNNNNSKGA